MSRSTISTIHLGYVVGTGEPVEIPLRHTAVTGQTQESGKTTTLEGLISRSGLQAVAYVTKRGESSFHVMRPIAPYFQERADWKFVQSLLEASTETKLKFEQSWIMRASEGARTLQDVRRNISRFLDGVKAPPLPPAPPPKRGKRAAEPKEPKERWIQKPARGLSGDVYYVLNKYLDDIMPQLAEMPYTTTLELAGGLNVMDLRDYEFPLQALVIRSVTDRIREHLDGTINIIPEAWKFAPKFRGSPVRLAAEEYVREAAAMKNFLWIDSQDLAGVADVLMRQVGVWLFGVQRATREIWRALEHMPEGLPAKRPRPADIATLSKGQFYVCFGKEMHKVYVQPAWMTAAHAEAIARGEEDVESAREILKEYADEQKEKNAKPVHDGLRKKAANVQRDGGIAQADIDSTTGRADRRDDQQRTIQTASQSKEESQTSSPREMSQHHEPPRTDTDAGRDRQPAKPEAASASVAACDARPVAPHDDPEEEAIWKERYEELKRDFEDFRNAVARDAAAANGNRDPGILQVTATRPVITTAIEKPEVQVKVKRRVIEMDGSTIQGAIAILLSEGFFDETKTGAAVVTELRRRGLKFGDATPYNRLNEIAEMGFLTKEGKASFRAIEGMKINIVEERA